MTADNEELDAIVRSLRNANRVEAADAITALRARVAELQAEIERAREHVGAIDEENFHLTRQLQQVKADAERKVYMCCDLHMGLPWTMTATHMPPPRVVCPHCEAAANLINDLSRRNDGTA